MRRTVILFLALLLCAATGWQAEAADYSRPENWAYCESGDSSKPVDVFFVCPAVLSETVRIAIWISTICRRGRISSGR